MFVNTFKDEPTKQAENTPKKVIITVDNLPDELRDMLDNALIKFDDQLRIQKLDPNYVQFGQGLRALSKEFNRHLKRLKEIEDRYMDDAAFAFVDDDVKPQMFFGDDDSGSHFCLIPEQTPEGLMDELIGWTVKKHDSFKKKLESIPRRAPARKEPTVLNALCCDITSIYAKAGGTPYVASHDAYEQNKEPIEESDQEQPEPLSPFVGFALEVAKMADIEIKSEREFADRFRPFIRQQVENNR